VSWQGLDAKEGEGEEDSDSQVSSSEEGYKESEDPMEGSSSDDDGDGVRRGGLENADNEEENGMGDGEQFGGEEEEMGGEPRSEEREESGVQAGPAQHSNARRPSRNVVTPARFAYAMVNVPVVIWGDTTKLA